MYAEASPIMTALVLLVVSLLMILSGTAKKRLVHRRSVCPVCRRERSACTCRWL